ncbi:ladderlectin-like [Branchiostoma floridae]|uniref:Ladderlectin-like n=1 Tax=Branchiostoma floridae TaxID=7739 RepID=A0A9J7M4H3_BRAFL|nr:ladderlectin-like [Branchiostoma floridae]
MRSFIFTVSSPLLELAQQCQTGWNEYNNHCYKLMAESVSGDSANQKCRGMGANLASVRDSQENTFIANTIKGAEGDMVWIGLKRKKKGFEWTDGSQFSYTNWAEGQPDNGNGGWNRREGCVIMYNKV